MNRVVIVGASLAAVHVIEGLRRNGYQGEIQLVGAEPQLPYDRPPLSKEALRAGPELDRLLLKEPGWYGTQAVELCLGTAAVGLDTRARQVVLEGGRELPYDGLVIATGGTARSLGGPEEVGPVHVIRSVADTAALHEQLVPGRHLVVIGAGFIGLEVAATAREMGLDVSVVEAAPVPLTRVLGGEAGAWFRDHHLANGVDLRCGSALEQVEVTSRGTKIQLVDGTVLAADVVVAGIGAVPATGWLDGSGVHVADGVVCDPTLRASAPGVVAAGDVARWHHPLFGQTMRVEQWRNAVEQGGRAALSLLGDTDAFAAVPYFWSDQFDAKVRFVGVAGGADTMHVEQTGDTSMVALFGRDGVIRGALCVNAPRLLARYQKAIVEQVAWGDVTGTG
ncbi:NAD(P)/FAD-dependent oxidoreductase [Streptomyces boluensis]|uniref:FAD-dependent oxidoreductase n=1 Tax=Streptomyces boluensis TaxID=1775135 RepID=A0A964XJZ0_9ACTN|nr:FAD-dependent oxidoreductase [Streptomyces boluensis]NBE50018.1 FAD-dependent oxidoreductase [Streptomyces boluensis]